MRRVLITTDGVGGVWQYSLALARGLIQEHGYRVMLVCLGEPPRDALSDALPWEDAELISLPLRLEWMPDSVGDVWRALDRMGRLVETWRPDILHSGQYCFGLLPSVVPKVVVAHSDVLTWATWHRGEGRPTSQFPPEFAGYLKLVSAGLDGASAVVCPTHFMARALMMAFGCRSAVIHNGLWPDLYPADARQGYAVIAGRLWDEAKRVDTAVEAVSGLPIELWAVGPTSGPSGESSRLPAASNVRYLGGQDWRTTRRIIARAGYYLATSSYEPFGLAALEAALCGCVLLASDIPSYRELWSGAASFFPVGDATTLRSRLISLLGDPAGAERRSQAARQRAMKMFTADRMAAKYAKLYEGLRTVCTKVQPAATIAIG